MKIISTSNPDLSIIKNEFADDESCVIVLPEGSWDGHQNIPDECLSATLEHRISVIGTMNTSRGFDVAYVVRNGQAFPAGICQRDIIPVHEIKNVGNLYLALNKPHEISPEEDAPILAIIRQGIEIYDNPVNGKSRVDVICLPSAIDHLLDKGDRDSLMGVNGKNISEKTLLVQAVLDDIAGTDIFQLPDFKRLGKPRDLYKVYEYSK